MKRRGLWEGNGKASPRIAVRNIQRTISLSLDSLRSFAEIAMMLVWPRRRAASGIISASVVLVSVVSDQRMARLHKRFCGVTGPTDVLTFQHGEIVISAETASRHARKFRSSLDQELRLYILHGLLHLCGYDDVTARERARMERVQRSLLKKAMLEARPLTRGKKRTASV
jgi:probable rRNA maturation factor